MYFSHAYSVPSPKGNLLNSNPSTCPLSSKYSLSSVLVAYLYSAKVLKIISPGNLTQSIPWFTENDAAVPVTHFRSCSILPQVNPGMPSIDDIALPNVVCLYLLNSRRAFIYSSPGVFAKTFP